LGYRILEDVHVAFFCERIHVDCLFLTPPLDVAGNARLKLPLTLSTEARRLLVFGCG